MSKLFMSLVGSAAILGSLVVAGVAVSKRSGPARGTVDLSLIESELSALREGMDGLSAELRAVRLAQESSGLRVPIAAEAGASSEEGEALASTLPNYVAAVLAEERKLQDAERERQREERRVRMEERRQELEAMREGPYDRYNLKVNSLAKALSLTDAQKQSYYQLVAAHQGKLEESMKQMREAREAARAQAAAGGEGEQTGQDGQAERGPGRGRRGDPAGREQFRELYDGLQKSFADSVTALLSPEQAQTYGELSRSAQSFQSTDMVGAPGEGGGGRFAGFGGGGTGATGTGGGFGGGGRGGGGGGGRRGR